MLGRQLAPGDTVLFYTDGVTEASSDGHIQFGVEGLDKVLYRPLKNFGGNSGGRSKTQLEEFTGVPSARGRSHGARHPREGLADQTRA